MMFWDILITFENILENLDVGPRTETELGHSAGRCRDKPGGWSPASKLACDRIIGPRPEASAGQSSGKPSPGTLVEKPPPLPY